VSLPVGGFFIKKMIGKIGNINKQEGLELYIFSNEEKIGSLLLFNFELSLEVHNTNYNILESVEHPILNNQNSIFLMSFKIEEPYRKQGFGKKLLNQAISETIKFGVDYLFLICKRDNYTAKKLYKNFGFEIYAKNETDELMYKKTPQNIEG
jgi:GNAT superfamily N-acetyltransferase